MAKLVIFGLAAFYKTENCSHACISSLSLIIRMTFQSLVIEKLIMLNVSISRGWDIRLLPCYDAVDCENY